MKVVYNILKVFVRNLRSILFLFGLILTVWRSWECGDKFLNNNLSTRVKMEKSYETILPALVVCPEYFAAYNLTKLQDFGIDSATSYRKGNWFGNTTSVEGAKIFKSVTHDFHDILHSFSVLYKNGKRLTSKNLNISEIGHKTYGRCFEIHFANDRNNVFLVDFVMKIPIYIFLTLPYEFHNEDSRSKILASPGEMLFMEITYEVLKNQHGSSCKKYNLLDNYDKCKTKSVDEKLKQKFNCSVPFLTESKQSLCQGDVAKEASKYFQDIMGVQTTKCPEPCNTMLTTFGFPFVTKFNETKPETSKARLYFKNIVKVTEDFVSYDLLR